MLINVAQLLKEPVGSTRTFKISEPIDINEDGNSRLVEGEVRLTRTGRSVLAQGRLHTSVKISCSRCLCLYDCPLEFDIEEEFFPVIDVFTGVPVATPEEPDYLTIDEHHILDMTEAVRQSAIVTIPMKPLCREECAGLCAQCGQDLNKGKCDCQTEIIDARWAKLASLKTKKTSRKRKERTE